MGGGHALLELGHLAGADDRRGHALVAEHPGSGHRGEGLAAFFGDLGETADFFHTDGIDLFGA